MVRISAAENHVMEALWASDALSADEIVAQVGAAQGWGEATVKTLIHRLLKKKALQSEREAGRVRYRPLISRDEHLTLESQTFLDRLFGGELAPLVAHYARHRQLSPAQMARLKTLIEDMEAGDD
ncbi:MAG: BlaI/MecI/CopY family transcriptional regulator [Caulobacteraceae bacterium]